MRISVGRMTLDGEIKNEYPSVKTNLIIFLTICSEGWLIDFS